MKVDLTWAAALFAVFAAIAWLVSTKTVPRERELARRRRLAQKTGVAPSLGGVNIVDEGTSYDLIATLRHQGQWNRWAAGAAAVSAVCQAVTLLLPS